MNLSDLSAGVSRRDFLKAWVAGGAVLAASGPLAFAKEGGVPIWVFHGSDKRKLMRECLKVIGQNGGFGKGVRNLALKVNAAWSRTPEQGANTHPHLVDEFIAGCKSMGVGKVVVPENSCHRPESTFEMSGILGAVQKHSHATMVNLKRAKAFRSVKLPKAKNLKEAEVAGHFLDADAVVNMPIAKHHGGAILSMAMKNWMGSVKDRGFWHRNDLHQCIADFSTFIKPVWTITDATRTLMDHGPQGPAREMKTPDLLILCRDQVAADAFAATLFHDDPMKVKYLRYAREQNIGETKLENMDVRRVEVA